MLIVPSEDGPSRATSHEVLETLEQILVKGRAGDSGVAYLTNPDPWPLNPGEPKPGDALHPKAKTKGPNPSYKAQERYGKGKTLEAV